MLLADNMYSFEAKRYRLVKWWHERKAYGYIAPWVVEVLLKIIVAKLWQLAKAELPIVLTRGKLTVVNLVQEAKAEVPIELACGKLTVVKLKQ